MSIARMFAAVARKKTGGGGTGTKLYVAASSGAIYQYTLSTPWDISSASYDSISATPITDCKGLYFKPDGTMLFAIENSALKSFNLSTAWNVSTASANETASSIGENPAGIDFAPDGTRTLNGIIQSDPITPFFRSRGVFTTPWDINPPTGSDTYGNLSNQLIENAPQSVRWGNSGGRAYVLYSNVVRHYVLGTAYDVSTLGSTSGKTISEDFAPRDFFLNGDGTKLYVLGTANDTIYQYTLSTPWDVSSASYDSVSKSVAAQTTSTWKMFIGG